MLFHTIRRGALAALLLCPALARAQTGTAPGTGTGAPAAPSPPTTPSTSPSTTPSTSPSTTPATTPSTTPATSPGDAPAAPADTPILSPPTVPGTARPFTPNPNQNTTAPVVAPGAGGTANSSNSPTTNGAAPNRGANNGANNGAANTSSAGSVGATDTAPAVAPVKAPAFPARGTLKIEGDAANMSVFAIGIDAAELMTAIASRGGIKLVIDDTISRRITLSVQNKPAREMLSSIAGAYGLAAAEVEGVTLVSEGIPRTPSSYLLSDIDQISTKYVDAANARNLLPVFLQDYVKVNAQQNAVVLSAPAEVIQKFRADVAGFDIPASQILVDLLLVELTDTGLDQLNLTLNYQNSGNVLSVSPSNGSVTFRALSTLPDLFGSTLVALQEKGVARVRANPRIATVSGRRASIFVGRQRYIVTPIDTGQGQRNFIDAGVRLDITPYTGGEKQIIIDLNAEVSTLSALDPVTRLPEKSTRTADTKVRVLDGQTLVIGGLKQSETRDVRTKVPLLGNLPLLGPLLFQSRNNRTTNTELVLFITPRILSDTGHLPRAEEDALKRDFLAPDLSAPLKPATQLDAYPRFKDAAPTPPSAPKAP